MTTAVTHHEQRNPTEAMLFVAFELSEKTWKLGFTTGHGQKPRERTVTARHHEHGFCQLVEADIVTRQIGTLPRSSLSLRQPALCPSSRPNSQIGSSFLGDTPTRTANAVAVGSVGQWDRMRRETVAHGREI